MESDLFKPIGKRLDNLNRKLKYDHPEDLWVMKDILSAFLSIIDSSSTTDQQRFVSKELNRLFDAYEYRYNTILETKFTMNKETLRMQMLSGVITEGEYKAKLNESKESLNENFVGLQMVGNIFDREKTDYELAFEHFTKESLSPPMKSETINESENSFKIQFRMWNELEQEFNPWSEFAMGTKSSDLASKEAATAYIDKIGGNKNPKLIQFQVIPN